MSSDGLLGPLHLGGSCTLLWFILKAFCTSSLILSGTKTSIGVFGFCLLPFP